MRYAPVFITEVFILCCYWSNAKITPTRAETGLDHSGHVFCPGQAGDMLYKNPNHILYWIKTCNEDLPASLINKQFLAYKITK